jgi:hypothetical protein
MAATGPDMRAKDLCVGLLLSGVCNARVCCRWVCPREAVGVGVTCTRKVSSHLPNSAHYLTMLIHLAHMSTYV